MKLTRLATLTILCLVILTVLPSCKDSSATFDEGVAETCRLLVDDKDWASAITTCADVDSDEGRHLTAQSYLGRAGLTLFDLTVAMTSATASQSTLLFDYAPDTTDDKGDYKSALDLLMGTTMEVKTQSMYLETLLVSSMMVFAELKTLLNLDVSGDSITSCVDASGDISACSFAPTYVHPSLQYPGLGSAFYNALCEDSSSDALTGWLDSNSIDFNPVTVDKCTIQTASVLYYNKLANTNYTGTGIDGLSVFDFYTNMDNGNNFTITDGATFSFCNDSPVGGIPIPDVSPDLKIGDCEVLYYLQNTGL